ncbi:hypothetical protein LCGC14_3071090 [marine sediment metagenome]|uniref:Uncharacterized protein n=1 Tax=marine sediment metagenome TaxID=412755 RepID=A0A0F8WGP9_9ZZZZ
MALRDKINYQLPTQFVCTNCGKIVEIKGVALTYSWLEICPECYLLKEVK